MSDHLTKVGLELLGQLRICHVVATIWFIHGILFLYLEPSLLFSPIFGPIWAVTVTAVASSGCHHSDGAPARRQWGCAHTFTLLFFIIFFMTTLVVIVFILLPKTIWSQTHWSWSFQWLLSKTSYVLMTKCAQGTFLEWLQCILEKEKTLSKVLVFCQYDLRNMCLVNFSFQSPFRIKWLLKLFLRCRGACVRIEMKLQRIVFQCQPFRGK